jgi:hypothetical protein
MIRNLSIVRVFRLNHSQQNTVILCDVTLSIRYINTDISDESKASILRTGHSETAVCTCRTTRRHIPNSPQSELKISHDCSQMLVDVKCSDSYYTDLFAWVHEFILKLLVEKPVAIQRGMFSFVHLILQTQSTVDSFISLHHFRVITVN